MRRLIVLLVLIAAGVLALRVSGVPGDDASTAPALSTPENSDYYMTDATVRQMDAQGDLVYRMQLGQTLHFPDDSARLRDIDVHYLAGTKTYWDVTAARGRIPPGERDIYLYGGVKAVHPRPDGPVLRIVTDNAWVRPDANRIDTRAHVEATRPGQRVTADGMEVDLDTDKLRLLDNVQVTYTPQ